MSIQDLIASVGDRLTPTERRIAKLVSDDPTLLAFGNVSDLAERADTSRPSIVRFATKLGFDGYSDLQNWMRRGVAERLNSPSQRIRRVRGPRDSTRADIEDAGRAAVAAIDDSRLDAIAERLARAGHVWIISGETSRAGAVVLESGLSMVRPGVHLVEDHATARTLSGAGKGDACVVIDFARYRRHAVETAVAIQARGVDVIAITDSPLSPLVPLACAWCELSVPAIGPFDSSVPAVSAAELIVARVVELLGEAARERIDQLEQLWRATGVFVDPQEPG